MTGPVAGTAARRADVVEQAVAIVSALRGRGQTVATAESLTGGLVGAAITSVPGASEVYRGGLIAYATELKHQLAGVPERTLAVDGPVAASTAAELARGAGRVCAADWGLATTGVAGPDGQAGHPVGQVFVAVAGPGGARPAGPESSGAGLSGAGLSSTGLSDAVASGGPVDDPGAASDETSGASQVWVRELALVGDRETIRRLTVSAVLDLFAELLGLAARSQPAQRPVTGTGVGGTG